MGISKAIDVIAKLDSSWEDAANHAVGEAASSVCNIKAFVIIKQRAIIADNEIEQYQVR